MNTLWVSRVQTITLALSLHKLMLETVYQEDIGDKILGTIVAIIE